MGSNNSVNNRLDKYKIKDKYLIELPLFENFIYHYIKDN